MILGTRGFKKWLGPECGTPVNGISPHIRSKRDQSSDPVPQEDTLNYEQEKWQHWICLHLDVGFASLQNTQK